MRYAQYNSGRKLHLVFEAGEGRNGNLTRKGYLSAPICGQPGPSYRMTINAPLGNACKNCLRMFETNKFQESLA